MASGKATRMDIRRPSSSYCSTATIVVFVALCLVGVWMLTSSSVVPVDLSSSDANSETKQATDISKPLEDNAGDLPEDPARVDVVNEKDESNSGSSPTIETTKKGTIDEAGGTETDQPNVQDKQREQTSEEDVNNVQQSNSDETSEGNANNEHSDTENKSNQEGNKQAEIGEKVEENQDSPTSGETKANVRGKDQSSGEVFPDVAHAELLNETTPQNGAWSTQAAESKNEKLVQSSSSKSEYTWKLCNVTAGADYIPCLDNEAAIRKLRSTKHYEHRERHCPEEAPTCLVPLPEGYKRSVKWPNSREKVWYSNVPHTKLAVVKGHQNWVKVTGEYLTFPGGGTQFKHGALHYIDFVQESLPDIAWGKRSRLVLDVGCGVASFGGYLFDRDVLTMSFAPKDEHEAQVQFALERGIPAVSAVMGTKRLPYPSRVFDIVHCARCRVPWHIEGGMLLLELNRLLRPGGYFVWSATPVYQNLPEDQGIWKAMSALTTSMCWEMVAKKKDAINNVGVAIYRKPLNNKCYENRKQNDPPLCQKSDDPDAAWNVPLQACMHKVPEEPAERGARWPAQWPDRLEKAPYWLENSQAGVYGKSAPDDFQADYDHWKHVVSKSYLNGLGIDWSTVRNVMDMRAVYGGFAASLRSMPVWVMNVVNIDSPDTLPIIYERGLFGMYHDWCESFSTYPRSYDLLHADHLFTKLKSRCKLLPVIVEVDRILRPQGKLIVRDKVDMVTEVESVLKSLHWEIRLTYSKDNEGLLFAQKSKWRPTDSEGSSSSMS